MGNEKMARWLGPIGVGFLVSIVLAFFVLSRNTPDQNASGADVVSFYRTHGTRETWSVYVIAIGIGLLAYYIGALRSVLRHANESHSWLADVAFVGGIVLTAAFAVGALGHWAVIDAANN